MPVRSFESGSIEHARPGRRIGEDFNGLNPEVSRVNQNHVSLTGGLL